MVAVRVQCTGTNAQNQLQVQGASRLSSLQQPMRARRLSARPHTTSICRISVGSAEKHADSAEHTERTRATDAHRHSCWPTVGLVCPALMALCVFHGII